MVRLVTAEEQLERATAFLASIPGAAEKAMARALNKAATIGREVAIRSVSDRYAVHAGDVRDKIALSTATPDRLGVEVVARSGSLALGYFPHSPVVPGSGGPGRPVLTAEVIRGQSKAIPGAFVATINGKSRIMIRTGGTTKTGRTQIKSLFGPPIAVMMGAESVREAVEARALVALDEQLGVEIDRALKADE
jgi:hypothetical protein